MKKIIDFNFENNNQLIAGSILVAEPFMADDYFSRSVVFLCDHNSDGSFGFVINKYVDTNLSEFVDDFPDINTRISIGGPVDMSNLFYIHSLGEEIEGCAPTSNGLFIGGDFEQIKSLLRNDASNADRIRFFIGYSGWDKGQLKSEMNEKSWIVLNNLPNSQILDTKIEDTWTNLMKKQGGKFKVMTKFPVNPSDN
tara:strand:- start:25546 stop:26133 length:588 start_codon:yes stop_codon:yes gene_type:complete